MAKKNRNAHGSGSIRQRPNGLWEARFTYTDDLGQPRRGSVYAFTQKECRQKLTATLKDIDNGTYHKTEKRYTVGAWLEEWLTTYCDDLKPKSLKVYHSRVYQHIIPALGKAPLNGLTNAQIQRFINKLAKSYSPKTVTLTHGVLHKALSQAVRNGLIPNNPADYIKLPKVKKPDLKPLMDEDVTRFLEAIKGERYEYLYYVDLFTGLRQSEILGLQWRDVDFETGRIEVRRQLQKDPFNPGYIVLDETKNGKTRTVSVSPSVVVVLKAQQRQQAEWQLAAGDAWQNDAGFIFTNELGQHLCHSTIQSDFKRVVKSIGLPETRFHDLRHSYAVLALGYGDSILEVSEALGHYSTSFTMDVYGAVSETSRKEAQARQEAFIKFISNG